LELWQALYVYRDFEHAIQFVIVAQGVPAIISCRHFVIAEAEAGFERCAGQ
jgi:hypothetical protein